MGDREPIDVAIVGGGIGGLALAIGLQQHGHIRTDIYEAASKFSEIGGECQSFRYKGLMMMSRSLCRCTDY
jgi:2-polyprenyl-6-methoxyphenol hydroxylase-like FAD-dependent oxidoreductase